MKVKSETKDALQSEKRFKANLNWGTRRDSKLQLAKS